ncbi:unnamed protein product, partial [Hapterophycus canaliculatus]
GVYVYLSDHWTVSGNYFGTDTTGNAVLASTTNPGVGFYTSNGSMQNTVGGATDSHRNIFSGLRDGVSFDDSAAQSNYVYNNWIGLGADGTTVLGNERDGITVLSTNNVVIGGAGGLGNVIVGSGRYGINLAYSNGNTTIQGNFIGQNEDGSVVSGNASQGIQIDSQEDGGSTIGGTAPGEGNTITASGGDGIAIIDSLSVDMTIRGNSIYDNVGLGI